jgi:phosphoribosyl 1,2-cyclic phosphate phosphodiesterase
MKNEKRLEIEVLGSGGAIATPRALCTCPVCTEAIEKGLPFSRCGPAYFVHGPDFLIDTPEEIRLQLTRSKISSISACFYSHWHPDHVAGRRIWECNFDYRAGIEPLRATNVYIPERVADDFKKFLGTWEALAYLESRGLVRLVVLRDGDAVDLNGVRVTPMPLAETYVYAFLIETPQRRAFIAPDELFGWEPPPSLGELDIAIIPTGLMEFDPFTGVRRLPEGFPSKIREMTFDEMLHVIPLIKASHIYLSHIEEPEEMSYSDYCRLEHILRAKGLPISFTYDMQKIVL